MRSPQTRADEQARRDALLEEIIPVLRLASADQLLLVRQFIQPLASANHSKKDR